jgi:hypothetical protein
MVGAIRQKPSPTLALAACTQANDPTTQPPRGNGGEVLLVVDVVYFVASRGTDTPSWNTVTPVWFGFAFETVPLNIRGIDHRLLQFVLRRVTQ